MFKKWLMPFAYHVIYWLILSGLTYGIYWQRTHIQYDHMMIRFLVDKLGFR